MPQYEPCPACSSRKATPVEYTWWGGIIGPKMLTHVRCSECGTQYNGKTGESNDRAIIAYAIGCAIVVGIAIYVYASIGGPK